MSGPEIIFDSGTGPRQTPLFNYLDGTATERALVDAYAWIKGLRHARVDGVPLRRRFTLRDDSLWWFTELYLHKQQVVAHIFRTLAALEQLIDCERPRTIGVVSRDRVAQLLAPQVAAARRVRCDTGRSTRSGSRLREVAAIDARAAWLYASSTASRWRRGVRLRRARPEIAAFVHKAFWRSGVSDGSAESYIGPVLEALENRLAHDQIQYVSVGPGENFRARRWWSPLRGTQPPAAAPSIENFAPMSRLGPSRSIWRDRHKNRRALWASADLREASIIRNCDCWPLVREALAGVALLQWPWSARAMDEAAAALDALQPRAALTYAEAGGWGRALMLECRRRGVPSIGLQHGFIYRHWLNYLHEPDEMLADPQHPADPGFPRPTLTLAFDRYAAHHLVTAGRFPQDSVEVTGSPGLDAAVAAAGRLGPQDVDRVRQQVGAGRDDLLILVATKHREARGVLPAIVKAAAAMPAVRVVIKTHPAETPDVYRAQTARCAHVTVLPAAAPLAPLLRASRALVTVNSTVALDAAVLGIPTLVVGLPNNLTPFVEAGMMAGAADEEIGPTLRRLLYDQEFILQLARARDACLTRFGIGSDGRAAERASEAVLRVVRGGAHVPRS